MTPGTLAILQGMKRSHKLLNLAGVMLPLLGLVAAIVVLWSTPWVGWTDLLIMLGMYVVSGYGVTLGFHRLLTHRAFQTHKPVEYGLAVAGSMAVQGPVMSWVADHRKHHAHTDQEGDPHSPHGHGGGVRGALKGLWYAHMGWLFDRAGQADHSRYAKELFEDPGMRRIHSLFAVWVLIGLAIPFGLGLLIDGTLAGALTAALWGGPVRIFLLHHVTWSINSVCHFFGTRRFAVEDESRNVFWLSLLSFGESWHHNHHAFPRSAVHGLKWWEVDPTAWLIRGMKATKLAWNVVEISPERQQQKLATAAETRPASRLAA
jgi:stearoyl-CoA desaturase (delta-9 desaturase)